MEIKVIHIITSLSSGGAQEMIYKTLKYRHSKNIKHYIISLSEYTSKQDKIKSHVHKIYNVDFKNKFFFIINLFLILKIIYDVKPNILQGWMYHGSFIALVVDFLNFKKNKFKLIWNIRHSLYDINKEKIITRIIIKILSFNSKIPSNIIYNSTIGQKQHYNFGFYNKKASFIPNGFEISNIKNQYNTSLKKKLKINTDYFIVGSFCRYHKMKGIEFLIDSFHDILKINNKIFLIIIGDNVPFNMKNYVERKKIPNKNYLLLDHQKDIYQYYNIVDLFVVTSLWGEGFSNVLGEAMNNSLPVLASDIGENRKIINNEKYIFPHGDKQNFIKNFEYIYKLNNTKREEIGKELRQIIINNYDILKISKKYEELYKK